MNKHRKQRFSSKKKGASRFRPLFHYNKNLHFEQIRKRMKMKTDGPTIDEMSDIDTTGNLERGTARTEPVQRPLSTAKQIRNWWDGNGKQIVVGVVVAVIASALLYIFGSLVHKHDVRLTEHDKDIEHLMETDNKHDKSIEKLNDRTIEMKTDLRLLEQRMEFTQGSSVHTSTENMK